MKYLLYEENNNINKTYEYISLIKGENKIGKLIKKKRDKIKNILICLIIIIIVFIIYFIFNCTKNSRKKFFNYSNNNKKFFNHILPKINLENNSIPSLEEIFNLII